MKKLNIIEFSSLSPKSWNDFEVSCLIGSTHHTGNRHVQLSLGYKPVVALTTDMFDIFREQLTSHEAACIILPPGNLIEKVRDAFGEHGWPLFCIRVFVLPYYGRHTEEELRSAIRIVSFMNILPATLDETRTAICALLQRRFQFESAMKMKESAHQM